MSKFAKLVGNSPIVALEHENETLKAMWKKQALFGNKMTQIVSEMDDLLTKKKVEIESLTSQLEAKSTANHPSSPNLVPKSDNYSDFSIDIQSQTTVETRSQIGFLEHENQLKIKIERLQKEFERTKDGRFKCPYKDICSQVLKNRQNLRNHIYRHTGERPYVCDICGQSFIKKSNCKVHMLSHPEMKGVQCDHCRKRIPESRIETHQARCKGKQQLVGFKRKRTDSDSEA